MGGTIVKPALPPGRPLIGPTRAPVTIVEYGDFICPYTNRSRSAVRALTAKYGKEVRFYFKAFPLDVHGEIAGIAAQYFEAVAAVDPNLAWPYFNALFDNQGRIRTKGQSAVRNLTTRMNIDLAVVDEERRDPAIRNQLIADITEAQSFGFTATPTFVINGRTLEGEVSERDLEDAVHSALRGK